MIKAAIKPILGDLGVITVNYPLRQLHGFDFDAQVSKPSAFCLNNMEYLNRSSQAGDSLHFSSIEANTEIDDFNLDEAGNLQASTSVELEQMSYREHISEKAVRRNIDFGTEVIKNFQNTPLNGDAIELLKSNPFKFYDAYGDYFKIGEERHVSVKGLTKKKEQHVSVQKGSSRSLISWFRTKFLNTGFEKREGSKMGYGSLQTIEENSELYQEKWHEFKYLLHAPKENLGSPKVKNSFLVPYEINNDYLRHVPDLLKFKNMMTIYKRLKTERNEALNQEPELIPLIKDQLEELSLLEDRIRNGNVTFKDATHSYYRILDGLDKAKSERLSNHNNLINLMVSTQNNMSL